MINLKWGKFIEQIPKNYGKFLQFYETKNQKVWDTLWFLLSKMSRFMERFFNFMEQKSKNMAQIVIFIEKNAQIYGTMYTNYWANQTILLSTFVIFMEQIIKFIEKLEKTYGTEFSFFGPITILFLSPEVCGKVKRSINLDILLNKNHNVSHTFWFFVS